MIWKKNHIHQDSILENQKVIEQFICSSKDLPNPAEETRVAIIGGGPKGFYALERLSAYMQEQSGSVTVDWFNETPHFGSGNNYRTDQPEYLLINYNIGNINIWIDEQEQITCEKMGLLQWIKNHNATEREVQFTDYASRALVGVYLQEGVRKTLENLHENLKVNLVPEPILDAEKTADRYKLTTKLGTQLIGYEKLLIVSGHSQSFDGNLEEELKALSASQSAFNFFPRAYPVEPNLTHQPLGQHVAIKGVGLTFIDATLALTEGRGGKFESIGEKLVYNPSGQEPLKIYCFSRSSLPMLPRGPIPQGKKYQLKHLTEEFFTNLLDKSEEGQIDFKESIFPLLKKEVEEAYHSTVSDSDRVAHNPDFSFETFLDPFQDVEFESGQEFHRAVESYIKNSIHEAKKGELKSPLMAAVAVWREITSHLGRIYNFGGFTPSSHKFLDSLGGNLCRVTYGPPVKNMEKMLALLEADILSFELGPSPEIIIQHNKAILTATKFSFSMEADTLIDARMARPNFSQGLNPLMNKLYEQGLLRPFYNGDYAPGCFEISETGAAIDATGKPNQDIHLAGTPTEGITFDNDTLSRYRNNLTSPWAKSVISTLQNQTIKPEVKLN